MEARLFGPALAKHTDPIDLHQAFARWVAQLECQYGHLEEFNLWLLPQCLTFAKFFRAAAHGVN